MKATAVGLWMGALSLMAAVSYAGGGAPQTPAMAVRVPVVVYGENAAGDPLYAPSGWMGKYDAIEMDDVCKDQPHSGDVCMKITFHDPENWGGIVWQNPPNNWGEEEGGFNLNGARQLSFWARGAEGTERLEVKFGILKDKLYSDSTRATLGHIRLSTSWKRYTIGLNGKNLSRIITPLCIAFAGVGKPFSFYLDDIVIE